MIKHRFILASLIVVSCFMTNRAFAQTYPQVEDGNIVYYKILSAYPDYEAQGLCLSDNTSARTSFNFLLSGLDADSRQQEWTLIASITGNESYFLRNRSSYRYLSTGGEWINNFYVQNFSSRKYDSDVFSISFLGDDQVAIYFNDENGKRYLGASDVEADPLSLPSNLKNSPWAWKIYKADDLANGILESFVPEPVITVNNRTINVVGVSDWKLFDIAGRQLEPNQTLIPGGVYFVRTNNLTKKVLVK